MNPYQLSIIGDIFFIALSFITGAVYGAWLANDTRRTKLKKRGKES